MKLTTSLITKSLVLATLSVGLAFTETGTLSNTHAASTFSSKDISGPSGYFSNSKLGVAFHWKNMRTSSGVRTILVFGDFKTPQFKIGQPVNNTLSKNKRTFNASYKMINNSKLSKKNAHFKLLKLSATKYRVKLTKYQHGYIPSNSGKTYTFTLTKKSPAKSLANKFARPTLSKQYKTQMEKNLQEQYKKAKAAGKNVQDPTTDSDLQAKVTSTVNTQVNKTVKQIVKIFG